jgi:type III secretion protein C
MKMRIERMSRCVCALLAAAALCGVAAPAMAAEPAWSSKKIVFAAIEPKDLRVFLREFAAQQGVGIFIDPEVKGELTGRYELAPRNMLELLARTFGLIWYYDGRILYIYPSTAIESAVLRLNESTPQQLERTLDRLGVSDARYPLSFDGDRGTMLVSGPKRYVELVKQAASASDRSSESAEQASAVRVFALKFAFAEDHQVTSGGREYRVPGVVSILRQAFAGEVRGFGVPDGTKVGLNARKPLEGGGGGATLPDNVATGSGSLLPELNSLREAVQGGSGGGGRGAPTFAADPRTNSVIVRDAPSRLDQYESLIQRLDERPRLVELETNIVEVNADDFGVLGIDWRVVGRRGSLETGGGGLSNSVTRPPGTVVGANEPSTLQSLGNVAGTVLGVVAGNRTQLFARISALEQAGKAMVSAQPKVMTLNNVEASLDATSTFYVPVQGFQSAQLFDVTSGTSIRITPSVVPPATSAPGHGVIEPGRDIVRLLIRIEDGGFTGQNVGNLPVIKRNTINTQSLVNEGSTLLIAGYAEERESRTKNGVPVLSSMPVIGAFFRSTETTTSRVERLYMITPRVVELQSIDTAKPLALVPSPLDNAPTAAPTAAPRQSSTATYAPAAPAYAAPPSTTQALPAPSTSPSREPAVVAAAPTAVRPRPPVPASAPAWAEVPPARTWDTQQRREENR